MQSKMSICLRLELNFLITSVWYRPKISILWDNFKIGGSKGVFALDKAETALLPRFLKLALMIEICHMHTCNPPQIQTAAWWLTIRLLLNQMNEEDLISRSSDHICHNAGIRHILWYHPHYIWLEGHASQLNRRDRRCRRCSGFGHARSHLNNCHQNMNRHRRVRMLWHNHSCRWRHCNNHRYSSNRNRQT